MDGRGAGPGKDPGCALPALVSGEGADPAAGADRGIGEARRARDRGGAVLDAGAAAPREAQRRGADLRLHAAGGGRLALRGAARAGPGAADARRVVSRADRFLSPNAEGAGPGRTRALALT